MKPLDKMLEKYEEAPSDTRMKNRRASAQQWAEKNYPGKWDAASEMAQDSLIDYEFSDGLKKYPKLSGAVLNGDALGIAKEFVRADPRRNKDWWRNYGAKLTGVNQKDAKSLAELKDILDEAQVPTVGIKLK